ncbi:MAG: hypothetical protein GX575_30000 [Candidatus Anammoximicrobium sp.]|nr:hypothetical protein [Candidatus Anammoximicrobium sp.]
MSAARWRGALLSLLLLWIGLDGRNASAGEAVPFPAALDAAAVSVQRLDSVLDDALLIGNGDLNALVYTDRGQLKLNLTKNDVWDARLDADRDPPLPTLELVRKWAFNRGATITQNGSVLLDDGVSWTGPDSYHAHPYPCPRLCARLILGAAAAEPNWIRIRAEGAQNGWDYRAGAGVMSIAGRAGASNGFSYGPIQVDTREYPELRVEVSGTENARFYVDLMGAEGQGVFGTGWQETPTETAVRTFPLPKGVAAAQVILYTWTEDGQRAENRFQEVALAGPRGKVTLNLEAQPEPTSPARLDIRRAAVAVKGNCRGVPSAAIRALADRNVILIDQGGAGRLEAARARDLPEPEPAQPQPGVQTILQQIPGDPGWAGMRFAVALVTRGGRQALAIVTSREAADPKAAAIQLASETLAAGPDAVLKAHEAVWERFWSRSGLELDDPLLQALWYRNLYFLRCVVRPGAVSPGLFASLVSDGPAWHGDYHTNYNIQSTYWPVYSSNHPELSEPYDRLIVDYLPRARWLCRELFGIEGAYLPHVLFAYEPPPEACRGPTRRQYIHHVWGWTLGVAGFSAQPVWWHYKYEPSREFLERVAYPVVREIADFQANFIGLCEPAADGKIVLAPTVSPEHWGWTKRFERNRNGAFCLGMFRYMFAAAIEGARTLGRDADRVARWQKAAALLPDYPLSAGPSPVVVDVQDAPPIGYNISVPATPVFPADVVSIWSPAAQRELFSRTIGQLRWNGNNSAILLSVARARLSMPETLPWVREELTARLRPNGTLTLNRNEPRHGFNNFGHYTEQFAASLAINELLFQSVADVVRVFPAWPLDRPARFRQLRAQGGFLVSAACANGAVGPVTVESTAGGRLRLLSPWPEIEVVGPEGKVRPLTPDGQGVVEWDTQAGQTFEFRARKRLLETKKA